MIWIAELWRTFHRAVPDTYETTVSRPSARLSRKSNRSQIPMLSRLHALTLATRTPGARALLDVPNLEDLPEVPSAPVGYARLRVEPEVLCVDPLLELLANLPTDDRDRVTPVAAVLQRAAVLARARALVGPVDLEACGVRALVLAVESTPSTRRPRPDEMASTRLRPPSLSVLKW